MKHSFTVRDEATLGEVIILISQLPNLHSGYKITVKPMDARTSEQNAMMWSMLGDISEQVEYHGKHLSKEEWKDLLTASIMHHRLIPALEGGGLVACGLKTSGFSKKEMSELIDRIEAFGGENGVKFTGGTVYERD